MNDSVKVTARAGFCDSDGFYANIKKGEKNDKQSIALLRIPKDLKLSELQDMSIPMLPEGTEDAAGEVVIPINERYELVQSKVEAVEQLLVPDDDELRLMAIPIMWTIRRRLNDHKESTSWGAPWGEELNFDGDVGITNRKKRTQPISLTRASPSPQKQDDNQAKKRTSKDNEKHRRDVEGKKKHKKSTAE